MSTPADPDICRVKWCGEVVDHTGPHRKRLYDGFAMDVRTGRPVIVQTWLQGESARVRGIVLVAAQCEVGLTWPPGRAAGIDVGDGSTTMVNVAVVAKQSDAPFDRASLWAQVLEEHRTWWRVLDRDEFGPFVVSGFVRGKQLHPRVVVVLVRVDKICALRYTWPQLSEDARSLTWLGLVSRESDETLVSANDVDCDAVYQPSAGVLGRQLDN